jgi:protein required for attachment to host cells
MARAWVVVADSARARFFTTEKPLGPIREIETLTHPESRLHARDLVSDAPGRAFDRAGDGRHAMEPPTHPHRAEALVFARQVAERIESARLAHDFDHLIIAAPPAFLGLLREHLSSDSRRQLVHEIHKNLAQLKVEELRRLLPEKLWNLQDG